MSELRCKGTRTDGERCRCTGHQVDPETGLCHAHRPGGRERMAELGRKGGLARVRKYHGPGSLGARDAPPAPKTIEDARAYASWAVHAVATGKIDNRVGKTIEAILREFREATRVVDLQSEVRRLSGELEALQDGEG